MKKKLLSLSLAALMCGSFAYAADVLNIGDATNINTGSTEIETPDFSKTYTPLQGMRINGYEFYIRYTGKNACYWKGINENEKLAYFYINSYTYFEITAPAGKTIDSFSIYTVLPDNTTGGDFSGSYPVTVVRDFDTAEQCAPFGLVTYEEPVEEQYTVDGETFTRECQTVIKWVNDSPDAATSITVRWPAFRRRNAYKIVINDVEAPASCTITPTPIANVPLKAGNCGTEQKPDGLANLRLNFNQTGISINPDCNDVITLSYGEKLVYQWDSPTIVTGETDYADLPGLNAGILKNPGLYTLNVPTGFFRFDDRDVVGGDITYTLMPTIDEKMLTYSAPLQSVGLSTIKVVELAIGTGFNNIFATDCFSAQLIKGNAVASYGTFKEVKDGKAYIEFEETSEAGTYIVKIDEGSFGCCQGDNEAWGPYVYNKEITEALITSSVESVISNECTQDVYGIDGRIVMKNASSISGLSKGLYIIGGKKVIIK